MNMIGFRLALTLGFACLVPLGLLIARHQSSTAFEIGLLCWFGAAWGIVWTWSKK
jgi:uncharacterized membrane protein (GlpM family)